MTRQGQQPDPDKRLVDLLSDEQIRLVKMLFTGITNRQIAYLMGINEQSVKNTLTRAYRATGAKNRPHLAALVWWELEGRQTHKPAR